MSRVAAAEPTQLRLLNGFRLVRDGESVGVPASGQHLLALLGMRGGATRALAAGSLWPESSEVRAQGSLRTTLWRLHRSCGPLVRCSRDSLVLDPDIVVDLHAFTKAAYRVLRADVRLGEDAARCVLVGGDLLPGWYQDWVLLERERLRQIRLHALEVLAQRLIAQHSYAEALEAAMECVCVEPLRESAHRAVVSVHLAQQNVLEALRHYDFFRVLIGNELGMEPSAQFTAMLPKQVRPASSGHPDDLPGDGIVGVGTLADDEAVHTVDP
jgi:DNA-binding SARP family transcriptional activator